jgi:signal transduction histidine kinase
MPARGGTRSAMTVTETPMAALPTEILAGAPPALRLVARQPGPNGAGAGGRVGMRYGRIANWLGSRRPLTFVAVLAIFTMGPVVLLSTLSVNSIYATVTDASNHRLAGASALAAVYVNTEMTALAQSEDAYVRRPSLIAALRDGNHVNFDAPVILAALKDIRALQTGTKFATIDDSSGTFWGNQDPAGSPALIGSNFSTTRDWYKGVVKSGKAYVSSAYVSALAGTPLVVAIATPVRADGHYAPSGTEVGILVVGYELSDTQRLFSDFALNQGVLIEVTDQSGVVVAQSGAVPNKLVQDTSAGVNAALKGKSSVDRLNIAGEDDFAAYSPVSDVGWTLVARVPASVALADANRLRASVIVITFLLLAILAVAKAVLYVVLRDRQGAQLALARANNSLEERVAGRTADLEASNRDLEAFSYSVSHDLRSPLRGIDGFSRLLLEENKEGLSAEGTRRLGLIRAGAQQMGNLIDDLLAFSRLGRVELKKRRVYTPGVVNEVITELKLENPDRKIEFVVQDLPPCYADPVLVKQVFRNLLGNAVKFSGTKPAARIEVGSNAGTGTKKARMVTYFVKDNGVGFDMRYSDKLFGVFQRLHRAEDFPGTGVGLALVRRIVERHGGTVWAEGALDAGATFYLTLEDGNART